MCMCVCVLYGYKYGMAGITLVRYGYGVVVWYGEVGFGMVLVHPPPPAL